MIKKQSVIGKILQRAGIIDAAGMAQAVELQSKSGIALPQAIAQLGLATEEAVVTAMAEGLDLECLNAEETMLTADVAALLPAGFCRQRMTVPLSVTGASLRLAMADPLDYFSIQDVEFRTGKQVVVVVAKHSMVESLLTRLYGVASDTPNGEIPDLGAAGEAEESAIAENEYEVEDPEMLAADSKSPPVVRLVNQVLSQAVKDGASDIHVEPQETNLLVRDRVDGLLRDLCKIPKEMQDAFISRLKIIAGMDIADRRRPQDGRSQLRYRGKKIDLRVSTLPTQYGEKVVLRILDSSKSQIAMEDMGIAPENLKVFKALLSLPQGMILVTGPTGSGKTSTLYTALNWVKLPTNNIITVEDPIEYRLAGVNQVQINTKAGVTFAAGLRSILRQDPNIIMVGEIRDRETAGIALEAAQTGHLLLSTLHTNNAPATITRLVDLGIEAFMVAASVVGILAQRLVRRPCAACKAPYTPSAAIIQKAGGAARLPEGAQWMAGRGCEQCGQSGYRGRMAIHELLEMSDELRSLITQLAPEHKLREAARRGGMRTLMEDGIAKAARGLTTLEELVSVVSADDATAEHAAGAPKALPAIVPAPQESTPRVVLDMPARGERVFAPLPSGGASGKWRVLIVEDSPTIVSVVKYFLELEGFEVFTAEDGLTGLAAARRELPQIVVSDKNMPGMDGVAMIKALRADPATSDVAILMLTSEDSIDSESEALAVGADDYLIKPVEPRRLAARVKALLARRQGRGAARSDASMVRTAG